MAVWNVAKVRSETTQKKFRKVAEKVSLRHTSVVVLTELGGHVGDEKEMARFLRSFFPGFYVSVTLPPARICGGVAILLALDKFECCEQIGAIKGSCLRVDARRIGTDIFVSTVGFYVPSPRDPRLRFLRQMIRRASFVPEPGCPFSKPLNVPILAGDWNFVEAATDRLSGRMSKDDVDSSELFSTFLALPAFRKFGRLVDVALQNHRQPVHTWSRRISTLMSSRIDRIYLPFGMVSSLTRVRVYRVSAVKSDHLLLHAEFRAPDQRRGNRRRRAICPTTFHYEDVRVLMGVALKQASELVAARGPSPTANQKKLSYAFARAYPVLLRFQRMLRSDIEDQIDLLTELRGGLRGKPFSSIQFAAMSASIENLQKQLTREFSWKDVVDGAAENASSASVYGAKGNFNRIPCAGIEGPDGSITTDPTEMARLQRTNWKPRLGRIPTIDWAELDRFLAQAYPDYVVTSDDNAHLLQDASAKELRALDWQVKLNKSSGLDGYPAEALSALNVLPNFVKIRRKACNEFLNGDILPESKRDVISVIAKAGMKPGVWRADEGRPVRVGQAGLRYFQLLLVERMNQRLSKWLHPYQFAFQQGKGISDILIVLRDLVVRSRLPGSELAGLIFQIDFLKAYDSLSFEAMGVILRAMGFSAGVIRLVHELLSGYSVHFCVGGFLSSPLDVLSGIAQGGPFMVMLFLLYCDPFLRVFSQELPGIELARSLRISGLQYADDFTGVLSSIAELMKASSLLSKWGRASNLVASPSKSRVLPLDRKTEQQLTENGSVFSFTDDTGSAWQLGVIWRGGQEKSLRILGLFFPALGCRLDLPEHVETKVRAAERVARFWRAQGLPFAQACTVAAACVPSRLEFLAQFLAFSAEAIRRVNAASRFVIFGKKGKGVKASHVRPPWDWLRLPRVYGGMGLQDIGLKIRALRASLVFRWLYLSRGGRETVSSMFWGRRDTTPGPWVEVFSEYARSVSSLLSCSVEVVLLHDQRQAIDQRLAKHPAMRPFYPHAADRTSPPALAFAAWWDMGGGFCVESMAGIFPGYHPEKRGTITSLDMPLSGNPLNPDPLNPDRPFVDWRYQDPMMTRADANIGAAMHRGGFEKSFADSSYRPYRGLRKDVHGIARHAEILALQNDDDRSMRSYVDSVQGVHPASLPRQHQETFYVDEVGWRIGTDKTVSPAIAPGLFLFRVHRGRVPAVAQWHFKAIDLTRVGEFTLYPSLHVRRWCEADGRCPTWTDNMSLDRADKNSCQLREQRWIYRRVLIQEHVDGSLEIWPVTAADALSLLGVSCGLRRENGLPLLLPTERSLAPKYWRGYVRDLYATVAKKEAPQRTNSGLFGQTLLVELRRLYERLFWLRLPHDVFFIAYGFITDSVYLRQRWHRCGVAVTDRCRRCHQFPETVGHVVRCRKFGAFRDFVRRSVNFSTHSELGALSNVVLFSLSVLPTGRALDAWIAACACAYEVMDWALRQGQPPDEAALQARWRYNISVCLQAVRVWFAALVKDRVTRGQSGGRIARKLNGVRERIGWYEFCLGGPAGAARAMDDGTVSFFGGDPLPDVGDAGYWLRFAR
jgi:Reverse transcriptase (RNA-dependent DNA polymerase)